MQTYAFTCGDINGIGPEICLKTFNKILPNKNHRVIYFCPANVFIDSCKHINPGFDFIITKNKNEIKNSNHPLTVVDIGKAKVTPGKPTKVSGQISFKSIKQAYESVESGLASAIITAPISKTALSLAGIDYPGHTEMLADFADTKDFVMCFLSDEMKAAMVVIHEPIKSTAAKVNKKNLTKTVDVVLSSLKNDFNINKPNIAVLGLNPHAGENGNIGLEEMNTIVPTLGKYSEENVEGPFVPDAFFGNKQYQKFDMTVGMYHDQILIPFKMLCFDEGVNYTAGLPFVRTSPDHGTAFDIAWENRASSTSIFAAFKWARTIVKSRSRRSE